MTLRTPLADPAADASRPFPTISLVVLCLGIFASGLSFVVVQQLETRLSRQNFEQTAHELAAAIKLAVDGGIAAANTVGALFDSTPDVGLAQFRIFAAQLLKEQQGIEAVIWVPRVPAVSRARFEELTRREFPDYRLWEMDAGLNPVEVAHRGEYFPVSLVQGKTDIRQVLGFDTNSSPVRVEAIHRARDTGAAAATGKVFGIGRPRASFTAFLIFRPVYHKGAVPETLEQRRELLRGFAMTVFFVDDLIGDVLSRLGPRNVKAALYDVTAPESPVFFGTWPPDSATPGSVSGAGLRHQVALAVGGRSWQAVMTPQPGTFSTTTWRAWAVLAAGLVLTALLLAYLESARRLADRMRRHAISDPLTGLHNRRNLWELMLREFSRAIRNGKPISCLLLDIDYFKRVNDAFGHDAGDLVLREVAALLLKNVRGSDITCRYGGDELVIVLPDSTAANAGRKAEQLARALGELKLSHRGRPLGGITVSVGVAAFPESAADPESLLHAADLAMYEAKKAGRNRVVVRAPLPLNTPTLAAVV